MIAAWVLSRASRSYILTSKSSSGVYRPPGRYYKTFSKTEPKKNKNLQIEHDPLEEYGHNFAQQMHQSIFGQLPEDPDGHVGFSCCEPFGPISSVLLLSFFNTL